MLLRNFGIVGLLLLFSSLSFAVGNELERRIEVLTGNQQTLEDRQNNLDRQQGRLATDLNRQNESHQGLKGKVDHEIRSLDSKISTLEENLFQIMEGLRTYIDNKINAHKRRIVRLRQDLTKLQKKQENQGLIGEIRYSLLTEEQFQERYGTSWVLLKGQAIGDSTLSELGWGNLPDARGLFLRCKNHERSDGQGNPAGDLNLGQYQSDEFKSHKHPLQDDGHTHDFIQDPKTTGPGGGLLVPFSNSSQGRFVENGNVIKKAQTGITVQKSGGDETRPRCITVNAFVKIHDQRDFPTQNEASAENNAAGLENSDEEESTGISSTVQ